MTSWSGTYFRIPGGGFVATFTKARASLEKKEQQQPDEPDQPALLCLVFIIYVLFVKDWAFQPLLLLLWETAIIGWCVSLGAKVWKNLPRPITNKSFAFSQCDIPVLCQKALSAQSAVPKKKIFISCVKMQKHEKQNIRCVKLQNANAARGRRACCDSSVHSVWVSPFGQEKKTKNSDIRWNRWCPR